MNGRFKRRAGEPGKHHKQRNARQPSENREDRSICFERRARMILEWTVGNEGGSDKCPSHSRGAKVCKTGGEWPTSCLYSNSMRFGVTAYVVSEIPDATKMVDIVFLSDHSVVGNHPE